MQKKILVIEDMDYIRANVLELLKAEGFEAFGAENGFKGITLAQEQIPDLILCDITMPELDGYGVLNSLRQATSTASIPFIFLTAHAEKVEIRQAMELGADDYLTKPFTRAELLGAVAARLNRQTAMARQQGLKVSELEEKLDYLRHYDSLTNLPNSQLLGERFSQTIAAGISQEHFVALLVLGLEQFDKIRSSLGPAYANTLFKAVSERLLNSLDGKGYLARLGTERLAVMLPSSDKRGEITNQTQALLDILAPPIIIADQEIFITARIGVALYPFDGIEFDTLIARAETGLLQAAQQPGSSYQFYAAAMETVSLNYLKMEGSLRQALERAEFEVYYQPQVSFKTGQIVGAEALIRWRHPERGLVPPLEFIGLAEQTGLIIPIGEWVLRTACLQTKAWQRLGFPTFRIAVNLSSHQFNQPALTVSVARLLAETGLDPNYLELELTEESVLKDAAAAAVTLGELKALGTHLAIDDFGTGYSSLSYLQKFPFDTLKIDRCFVQDVTKIPESKAITTAIIQMAHILNLKIVAEGVETEDERFFLAQHGCHELQGYLFSRPVAAQDFEILLTTNK